MPNRTEYQRGWYKNNSEHWAEYRKKYNSTDKAKLRNRLYIKQYRLYLKVVNELMKIEY